MVRRVARIVRPLTDTFMKSLLSLMMMAGVFLVLALVAALWTYSDIKKKKPDEAAKDSKNDNAA